MLTSVFKAARPGKKSRGHGCGNRGSRDPLAPPLLRTYVFFVQFISLVRIDTMSLGRIGPGPYLLMLAVVGASWTGGGHTEQVGGVGGDVSHRYRGSHPPKLQGDRVRTQTPSRSSRSGCGSGRGRKLRRLRQKPDDPRLRPVPQENECRWPRYRPYQARIWRNGR